MKTIYVCVEHLDREYGTAKQLALSLHQQLPCEVYIVSVQFHGHHLLTLPSPDIVILPFSYSTNDWPLHMLRDMYGDTIQYYCLSWEQFLWPFSREFKRPHDDFVRQHVHYFAWHEAYRDFLQDSGVPSSTISVIGDPNVDRLLVSDDEKAAIVSEVTTRLGDRAGTPIWFFPMNLVWAFLSEREVVKRIQGGYVEQDTRAYQRFVKDTFPLACDMLADIVRKREVTLVVRPHPSVPLHYYEDAFRERFDGRIPESVLITRDLSIREWIHCSDAVVSTTSTAVYHAQLLGKPAAFMRPLPLESRFEVAFMQSIPVATTVDELIHHCEQPSQAPRVEKGKTLALMTRSIVDHQQDLRPKQSVWQRVRRLSKSSWILGSRYMIRTLLIRLGLRHVGLRQDWCRVEHIPYASES